MIELPDRYRLLESLPTQQGIVRAQDTLLGREILVQLPRTDAALGSSTRSRGLREAQSVSRCDHPNLVRLFDALDTEFGPILILEPFVGTRLAQAVSEGGAWDAESVWKLGAASADALLEVHKQGIVHRGVSEEALFVDHDRTLTKIHGFDFAKPVNLSAASSLAYKNPSSSAERRELPPYPAPEQWQGASADSRVDVFALGCTLRFALTGQRVDDTTMVVRLAAERPDLPKDLVALIDRATAASPLQRIPNMAVFRDELLRLGQSPRAASTGAGARGPGGRRLLAACAAVALPLLGWMGMSAFSAGDDGSPGSRGGGIIPPGEADQTADARRALEGALLPRYTASHALLIGINYDSADAPWSRFALRNAERDVDAIANKLVETGWEQGNVLSLRGSEATRDGIDRALLDLEMRTSENDQVFIYFAGHGLKHPNSRESGWAIPFDAAFPPGETIQEQENWIHFDRFDRVFREFRAKHVLIALDCCHGGAGMSPARSGLDARGHSEQIGRYLSEPARVMIASARAHETALDGFGDHSPFAMGFLEALDVAKSKNLSATQLLARVQDTITRVLQSSQRPFMMAHRSSAPGGEFFFVPSGK
jgi:hypothetical protein